MDSAESVLAGALENHYKMINEFKVNIKIPQMLLL